ncbi:MAG: hypothetical protein JSV54_04945, partial [Chloroflexota bacterium]
MPEFPVEAYNIGYEQPNKEKAWANFTPTGECKVGLIVTDDEDVSSVKTECIVRVVEVDVSGGGYICVGGMDEIQLSVDPDNNWSNCSV